MNALLSDWEILRKRRNTVAVRRHFVFNAVVSNSHVKHEQAMHRYGHIYTVCVVKWAKERFTAADIKELSGTVEIIRFRTTVTIPAAPAS